jgi:hypothetical protein
MKDQSTACPSLVKMEEARRLMEQGQHRESLLLALDVLLQELNNLRESLIGLQMIAHFDLKPSAPPVEEEPPEPDFYWLPPAKARILH